MCPTNTKQMELSPYKASSGISYREFSNLRGLNRVAGKLDREVTAWIDGSKLDDCTTLATYNRPY